MPLVPLDALEPLLVCPRCGMRLLREREGFHCESSTCVYGSEGSFRLVDGAPVVIDFDRSIVRKMEVDDAAGAGSVPPLRAGSSSFERLPGWLRRVWRPTNRVAARNVQQLIALLPSSSTVLVVGGGTIGNGVDALYVQPGLRIVAFDVYSSPNVQFLADAHQIPLADSSIDAVVVQAVLEHVLDPERVVSEIVRVLRPEGLVYAETPFLQQVHAGPYDFVRYTSSGHRFLFRSFEELASGPVAGPGTQLLWSVEHLAGGLFRSRTAGKVARGMFIWLRYLDGAVAERFAIDSASAFCFLGRRASREMTADEIVEYYRGAQAHRP
jgi:SAM-dependent methyltransferase